MKPHNNIDFVDFKWQVRRQRQVEQELTLKDCQKKTEQLQLWLANIAQTLDHVTRINDQSQIEVNHSRLIRI